MAGDILTIFDNFLVFTALMVTIAGTVGLMSRSMAMASFGGYLTFVFIAVETGNQLLQSILYVTLILVFVGMAMKLWRLEGTGE